MKRKRGDQGDFDRTKRASRKTRLTVLTVAVAGLCLSVVALAGCQPAATDMADTGSGAAAGQPASATAEAANLPGTFTNVDAGQWGDTQYAQAVNAGNRGCNACHGDLFSVLPHGNNSKGLHEVDKAAAYGRVYTYNDCTTCHIHSGGDGMATGGSGPYLAPSIHGSHFSNGTFLAQGGNCFSCHEGNIADGTLGMWDELKYTKTIGLGNEAPLEAISTWLQGRGYETSTVTGGTVAHNVKLDNVVSTQDPTASAADLYSATNMDYPDVADSDWTVTVKGVKNEKTYTLDELRAMPQTELTYTRVCGTNGGNGGWYIANIPVKGVLLADLVADCGGLADGVDVFSALGYDGWSGPFTPGLTPASIDQYLNSGAMIALEQFGEAIDTMDGGPAYMVVPGGVAFLGCKWVTEVDFFKGDGSEVVSIGDWGMATTTSTWLSPNIDGQTVKVGEPVELSGVAWAMTEQLGFQTAAVKVSADYGETWTDIPLPENMDANQWVKWSATWTPEAPGTYCLTMHTDSTNPEAVANDGSVLIKVVE